MGGNTIIHMFTPGQGTTIENPRTVPPIPLFDSGGSFKRDPNTTVGTKNLIICVKFKINLNLIILGHAI